MNRTRHLLTAALGLALAVTACAPTAGAPTWTYPPTPAGAGDAAAGGASPSAGMAMDMGGSNAPAAGAIPAGGTIAIEAFDLGYTPAAITVAAPGTYPVSFENTGSTTHDVTFADGTKLTADAGATVKGTVNVPAAGIGFLCSIPGHAAAGMTAKVLVAGAAPAPSTPPTTGTTAAAPVADPNAPPYVLRDAAAPQVLPGTVHDVDLPIIETDITVAKGFVVHAWTFGGTVPGPTLRVHLGDTVRVHLTNRGSMTHSIDFHASQTAMNDQMIEIKPGETFTYTFTADYAGVWMYHCGTAPALHHIANGMFGMVIVEPKGGLPKVDQEVALVQSEWYLGAQKEPADYTKASAGAPSPDFVVFNGIADQYKDNPIMVDTKGRVRVFVLDAGPNIDSSFHVVGTIFDTVVKEGVVLAKGNAGGWGSQAVDLAPAQGAIVEFSPQEDGMYPMVTHAFNFVGKGAIGMFMAGDGDPSN
ncbi:MAG TPA: multicopper oxidase domain-containing protein [Candidatus Limnocylindrales bacterium]|nr:multicopper oxidase domain-containing protein [Candidatus Limnocylindrales bacterium]